MQQRHRNSQDFAGAKDFPLPLNEERGGEIFGLVLKQHAELS